MLCSWFSCQFSSRMWDKPVHVSVLFLISQQLPGSKGHWEGEFVSLVPPGSLGFSWKMHPEGSLGAAGRRCCCPLPLPVFTPICVHSKPKGAAPSSRQKILGVVVPTCKAPGEPGGFSSAFPAGILLEGGRGSPWVCLRRVVPFTRCPSASLATPGARGCSRQASSHP